MDRVKIYRAMVDWWKTWMTATMAATIASQVGYWTIRDKSEIGRISFLLTTILFAVAFTFCVVAYISRHEKLMKELYK